MKFLQDTFLVSADMDGNAVDGSTGITINRKFDPYGTAMQIGVIASVPDRFTRNHDCDHLKVGDQVLLHHFVCQPDNIITVDGKDLFMADPVLIWAVVNEGPKLLGSTEKMLVPVGDWCFVMPIEDDEDEFIESVQIKFAHGNKIGTGILTFPSDISEKMGLIDGLKVHFIKNADYSINVGGQSFYRMKNHAIIATEKDGEVFPVGQRIMISEDESHSHNPLGLILPSHITNKESIGEVVKVGDLISSVKPGEKVSYFHNTFTPFFFGGKKFAILEERNLIYKQI